MLRWLRSSSLNDFWASAGSTTYGSGGMCLSFFVLLKRLRSNLAGRILLMIMANSQMQWLCDRVMLFIRSPRRTINDPTFTDLSSVLYPETCSRTIRTGWCSKPRPRVTYTNPSWLIRSSENVSGSWRRQQYCSAWGLSKLLPQGFYSVQAIRPAFCGARTHSVSDQAIGDDFLNHHVGCLSGTTNHLSVNKKLKDKAKVRTSQAQQVFGLYRPKDVWEECWCKRKAKIGYVEGQKKLQEGLYKCPRQ